MTYDLGCPECYTINQVEATIPRNIWDCTGCDARAVTTLATEEDLVTLIPPEEHYG